MVNRTAGRMASASARPHGTDGAQSKLVKTGFVAQSWPTPVVAHTALRAGWSLHTDMRGCLLWVSAGSLASSLLAEQFVATQGPQLREFSGSAFGSWAWRRAGRRGTIRSTRRILSISRRLVRMLALLCLHHCGNNGCGPCGASAQEAKRLGRVFAKSGQGRFEFS